MSMMGPTQLQKLEGRSHAEGRYFISSLSYLVLLWILGIAAVVLIPSCETSLEEVPQLVWSVLTFERFPITAQDNTASCIATLLCLIPIWVFDFIICRPFLPNSRIEMVSYSCSGKHVRMYSRHTRFLVDRKESLGCTERGVLSILTVTCVYVVVFMTYTL